MFKSPARRSLVPHASVTPFPDVTGLNRPRYRRGVNERLHYFRLAPKAGH
jgi:hypothetical protein